MNRETAQEKLTEGNTLTHKFFSEKEFVFINENGKYETEDGVKYKSQDEFWNLRQDDCWDCDWKIVYEKNIGGKVTKKRTKRNGDQRQSKPFKSGLQINTVKGIVNHPKLNIPAYTFEEDESYVECRRCHLVN